MLKRILIVSKSVLYIILCLCFLLYLFYVNSKFDLCKTLRIDESKVLKHEVYLKSNSSNCEIKDEKTISDMFNTYGESIVIEKEEFDLGKILSYIKAEIIKTEETSDGVSYYAYSDEIKYCKDLFDSKVNLHIYVSNSSESETVKIGSPIIFSSY